MLPRHRYRVPAFATDCPGLKWAEAKFGSSADCACRYRGFPLPHRARPSASSENVQVGIFRRHFKSAIGAQQLPTASSRSPGPDRARCRSSMRVAEGVIRVILQQSIGSRNVASVANAKIAALPRRDRARSAGLGRLGCILPDGPRRHLHSITLLDLGEAARTVGPWDIVAAVDHSNQGAAASKVAVVAVIQLAGILLVNKPALAAGCLGDGEPRGCVSDTEQVGAIDQRGTTQVIGVGAERDRAPRCVETAILSTVAAALKFWTVL